jgi:CBS domain-containing protein
VFAIAGLLVPGYFMLLLIAIFVWFGAQAEAAAVRAQSGLAGVPVSQVMVRDFVTVAPDDTLDDAARQLLHGFQPDLPVVVGDRIVGMLTRRDLEEGMAEFGPNGRVMRVMRREFPVVSPDEPAENAIRALSSGAAVVPVLYVGRLVGLLTADNVADFLWFRNIPRTPRRDTRVHVR